MEKIIPVTDLQRQAASILNEVNQTAEPVIITRRGRASAVLISAKRYAEIEEHLALLDELELVSLIQEGEEVITRSETISKSRFAALKNYRQIVYRRRFRAIYRCDKREDAVYLVAVQDCRQKLPTALELKKAERGNDMSVDE